MVGGAHRNARPWPGRLDPAVLLARGWWREFPSAAKQRHVSRRSIEAGESKFLLPIQDAYDTARTARLARTVTPINSLAAEASTAPRGFARIRPAASHLPGVRRRSPCLGRPVRARPYRCSSRPGALPGAAVVPKSGALPRGVPLAGDRSHLRLCPGVGGQGQVSDHGSGRRLGPPLLICPAGPHRSGPDVTIDACSPTR